jgi:hypothetical protein
MVAQKAWHRHPDNRSIPPVTYDPTDFVAGLDTLRNAWLQRRLDITGPYRKDWGWVRSDADKDGTSPTYHLGGIWEPKSNHAKIEKSVWEQKMRGTFDAMTANLRTIPALDFPELHWSISFEEGNGQANFHLDILGTPISKRYLTSTKTVKKRLNAIGHDLSGMPHGANLNVYKCGRYKMRAETGIAALRVRIAFSGIDHDAFVTRMNRRLPEIHPPLAA